MWFFKRYGQFFTRKSWRIQKMESQAEQNAHSSFPNPDFGCSYTIDIETSGHIAAAAPSADKKFNAFF